MLMDRGKANSSLPFGPETPILESNKDTSAPLGIDIGSFAILDIIKIPHKLFHHQHLMLWPVYQ